MMSAFVSSPTARAPRLARVPLFESTLATPLGPFTIVTDESAELHAAGFHFSPRFAQREAPRSITSALAAYFAGEFHALDALTLAITGTPFQREVWRALRTIPRGETRSYSDIARQIGRPQAVRAVGLANGSNPISIIVPCHRVIGASGALTGYAGGLERKRWLLAHERFAASPRMTAFEGL